MRQFAPSRPAQFNCGSTARFNPSPASEADWVEPSESALQPSPGQTNFQTAAYMTGQIVGTVAPPIIEGLTSSKKKPKKKPVEEVEVEESSSIWPWVLGGVGVVVLVGGAIYTVRSR